MPPTLRLVLGDQLNPQHPWFQAVRPEVCYALLELRQEGTYVHHHRQKLLGFFGAMRRFANQLEAAGHRVRYQRLDEAGAPPDLPASLRRLLVETGATRFEYQWPDEYRLDEQLRAFCAELTLPTAAVDTHHFVTGRQEVADFFAGKKTYLLESFYRHLRRREGLLMQGGNEPAGGRWNFDAENRKKLPHQLTPPPPLRFEHDLTAIDGMIEAQGLPHFGEADASTFPWPLNREEGLKLLDHFIEHLLPNFGRYQDALTHRHNSLYHSRLSFALNTKMLSPAEVVQRVAATWEERPTHAGLAQVEGFIRQVLGWREFIRGVYWAQMPAYAERNFFDHRRALPSWYWTGEVRMACLRHSIGQSLSEAYAHHIQRLMVIGNFALLMGADPADVDAWYLGVYIDAIEWVELPNTRGMSQFADGGLLATKPYVASANYIHKMSDYCRACPYDRTKKTGPEACPFNSLYWHFYDRHEQQLADNHRIGMMYRVWRNKFSADERAAILQQAETNLARLEEL